MEFVQLETSLVLLKKIWLHLIFLSSSDLLGFFGRSIGCIFLEMEISLMIFSFIATAQNMWYVLQSNCIYQSVSWATNEGKVYIWIPKLSQLFFIYYFIKFGQRALGNVSSNVGAYSSNILMDLLQQPRDSSKMKWISLVIRLWEETRSSVYSKGRMLCLKGKVLFPSS